MPITRVEDPDASPGTCDHRCPGCGLVATLALDPAAGDLAVVGDPGDGGAPDVLVVRACPACGASESLHARLLPHDAGEGPQPGSLVGTRFEDTGGVVTEHYVGATGDPQRLALAALQRALQWHPDLAPHAPVREAVLLGRALDAVAASLAPLAASAFPAPPAAAAPGPADGAPAADPTP